MISKLDLHKKKQDAQPRRRCHRYARAIIQDPELTDTAHLFDNNNNKSPRNDVKVITDGKIINVTEGPIDADQYAES